MPFVALIGSGPLGGALAHALALRDRIREIRLIDPHASLAQGKALDIQQSSPVDRFSCRMTSAQSLHAAAGATAIAIADEGATGVEHGGEAGLALVRQIAEVESAAPLVFAGATQAETIGRAVSELHLTRARVLGTAPGALESALRALTGLAIDASGVEVQLRIVGTPPNAVAVGWEEATASGLPLRAQLPPHAMASLSARIPTLWPPGPLALAAAAARVVEAIAEGSRRRFTCFTALDSGPSRHAVVAMPMEVGPAGIVRVLQPQLTGRERAVMENAIEGFK